MGVRVGDTGKALPLLEAVGGALVDGEVLLLGVPPALLVPLGEGEAEAPALPLGEGDPVCEAVHELVRETGGVALPVRDDDGVLEGVRLGDGVPLGVGSGVPPLYAPPHTGSLAYTMLPAP